MRRLNDASSPSCSILQDAGAQLVRNGAAGLVKKHLHNTWKFSATEEMGQIALSDFEYLPREREEGAPGVVLHPCAYNPGPALSGDKKKYIRQNQSSMEPQKERRFQKEGKNSLEGWSTGNPVSNEDPQTLQLGMGLVLWKLALHPHPLRVPDCSLAGSGRKAWCRENPQRKLKRSWSRKVRLNSSLGSRPLSQACLWERPQARTRQVSVPRSECTTESPSDPFPL